ncbi:MAG: Rpn family recombination-promoting nuclease/putative transposase [Sphaerospermopsis sp. SIO1G2]|nr:Rpn family recombination-promoting nuclease/putative transposase [Sphaerospermopsis sp. SIO1G2]
MKLIISKPDIAINQAKELINRTKQEVKSQPKQQQLLELIETILVYKLPKMKREEIESMFGLSDLKQTRFYQEALEEGLEQGLEQGRQEAKLNAVPGLVGLGLSQAQIAQVLNLSIDEVKKIVDKMSK